MQTRAHVICNRQKVLDHTHNSTGNGVSLDQCASIFKKVRAGQDGTEAADTLFQMFDRDPASKIDFAELTVGLSALMRGSLSEKLRILFDCCEPRPPLPVLASLAACVCIKVGKISNESTTCIHYFVQSTVRPVLDSAFNMVVADLATAVRCNMCR